MEEVLCDLVLHVFGVRTTAVLVLLPLSYCSLNQHEVLEWSRAERDADQDGTIRASFRLQVHSTVAGFVLPAIMNKHYVTAQRREF